MSSRYGRKRWRFLIFANSWNDQSSNRVKRSFSVRVVWFGVPIFSFGENPRLLSFPNKQTATSYIDKGDELVRRVQYRVDVHHLDVVLFYCQKSRRKFLSLFRPRWKKKNHDATNVIEHREMMKVILANITQICFWIGTHQRISCVTCVVARCLPRCTRSGPRLSLLSFLNEDVTTQTNKLG